MRRLSIVECGQAAAVAVLGQRDLLDRAAAYPDVFLPGLFDPALYGGIALANAFSSPGLPAERLFPANRTALWAFAVDHQVDRVATTHAEVAGLVKRCVAVAGGGAAPGDGLTGFLAEIRDDLTSAPAYPVLGVVWREQVARTLEAMGREWAWRAAGIRPTLPEYLSNADNLGFCLVFAAHWVAVGARVPGEHVLDAAQAVQRALRLVNDLSTVERDEATGDLNALQLGLDRPAAASMLRTLVAEARRATGQLEQATLASYLDGQLGFNRGFHPVTDYWPGERAAPS